MGAEKKEACPIDFKPLSKNYIMLFSHWNYIIKIIQEKKYFELDFLLEF